MLWKCDCICVSDSYIDAYTLSLSIACLLYVFYSYLNCIKYLQAAGSFLAVLVQSVGRCELNLCTRGASSRVKGVCFDFLSSPHVV